jgi:hypothetical protein
MKTDDLIGWKPKFYDPTVASVRIRCLNPLSELRARGYPIELFNDTRCSTYRVVVYSKLYDDASYGEAVRLKTQGVRIILDLCDNHFYNPSAWGPLVKARGELLRMLALTDYVVTSTETLAEVVRTVKPDVSPITVIGDAVEIDIEEEFTSMWRRWWHRRQLAKLLAAIEEEQKEGRTPLVWFGIHGGPNAPYGMLDLLRIRPCVEGLNSQFPLSLTVISNSWHKYFKMIRPWAIPTRYIPWSANTFLTALRAHAIAVVPVSNNPFTRCKTNNRLVTALQAGVAVVADPIPSYDEFRCVTRLDSWESGLREYLLNPDLRLQDVQHAKSIIDARWTLPRIADQWQSFFEKVLSASRGMA